jgi:hypothetical protein
MRPPGVSMMTLPCKCTGVEVVVREIPRGYSFGFEEIEGSDD